MEVTLTSRCYMHVVLETFAFVYNTYLTVVDLLESS